MQELTLTGGTLLSDKHVVKTSTTTTATTDHSHDHHQHNHGDEKKDCCKHHHDHNHNHHDDHHNHTHHDGAAACPLQPMAMPNNSHAMVTLNMPASQLVQQDVPQVLQALKIVTRMGSMALLQEIMQAWKEHLMTTTTNTTSNTSNKSSKVDAIQAAETMIAEYVSQVDNEGHSLLHWAAKRADGNAAFVHYWAKYITPIHIATNDGTGMTCLHWACTENASSSQSLSIIKHLLQINHGSLLETPDASGCTPLLIAAQYGQVTTAAYLIQKGANYASSMDENRDTATHWAAYKGSSAVLGLLVYYLQARHLVQVDVYGQLPLHLAALRGHVSVCRYIIQSIINQGDQHGGGSGDGSNSNTSASSRMAATIRNKRQALDCLLLKDKNGRTPEELARHKKKPMVAAVLQQITEDLQHQLYIQQKQQQQQRGNNNNTTLTSIKTRLYHTCWHPTLVIFKSITSKHRWMVWLGIQPVSENGMEEQDEAPYFPFHYVIGQMVANFAFYWSVFVPVLTQDMNAGVLYDYVLFHVFNMIMFWSNIILFIYTHRTDPGRLVSTDLVSSATTSSGGGGLFSSLFCCTATDKKQQAKMNQIVDYWRRKYEETLEAYAQDDHYDNNMNKTTSSAVEYQLCHSCHLARPLRSKHDKYSHACILLFDHYCPFVGTSIGLYNYKHFYLFLLTMTLYFGGFWYMLLVFISRHRQAAKAAAAAAAAAISTGANSHSSSISGMPWMSLCLGIYLGLHIFISGGMLVYHTQLVIANLTTNEHLNMARYDYLWTSSSSASATGQQSQQQRRYKNPWFKGWLGNFMDRFNPSEASYMLPEQHEGLLPLQQQRPAAATSSSFTNNNNSKNDPLSSVV